jgi:hypothetical protein
MTKEENHSLWKYCHYSNFIHQIQIFFYSMEIDDAHMNYFSQVFKLIYNSLYICNVYEWGIISFSGIGPGLDLVLLHLRIMKICIGNLTLNQRRYEIFSHEVTCFLLNSSTSNICPSHKQNFITLLF